MNKTLLVLSPPQADGVFGERAFILRTSRFSTLADSPLSSTGKLPFPRPPSHNSAFIPAAELSGNSADLLNNEQNYSAWRDFFRSIGSNPYLKDKTLSINWGELFDFTAKTKAGFVSRSEPRRTVGASDAPFSANVSLCGPAGSRTPDSIMP